MPLFKFKNLILILIFICATTIVFAQTQVIVPGYKPPQSQKPTTTTPTSPVNLPAEGTESTTTTKTLNNQNTINPTVRSQWEQFWANLQTCTPGNFALPTIAPVNPPVVTNSSTNYVIIGKENDKCHLKIYTPTPAKGQVPANMLPSLPSEIKPQDVYDVTIVGQDCMLSNDTIGLYINNQKQRMAGTYQFNPNDPLIKAMFDQCNVIANIQGHEILIKMPS